MYENVSHRLTALEYARQGWRVVRTDRGRKFPVMKNWQINATTDEAQIDWWFTQYPDSNICIATGEDSNLFVLDVDGEAGETTLFNLQRAHAQLPVTYTVRTRSGGLHYYFTWDGIDFNLGNSAGKLGTGLDTRGNGGQVVAPPSYAVADDKGPEGVYSVLTASPVVPAPQWLIDLLRPSEGHREPGRVVANLPTDISRYGEKALESAIDTILNAPDGEQNNTIFKETAGMKEIFIAGGLGNDEEYIKSSLLQAAVGGNHPSHRAVATIDSAWNREVEPRNIGLSPKDFTQDASVPTYSLDDFGNADRVIARHEDTLAYVLAGDKSHWALYNGVKWETSKADAQVLAMVKDVLRTMQDTEEQGWTPGKDREAFVAHAKKSRSANAVRSAFNSLSYEGPLHRPSEEFDTYPHMLNFSNGTLDTRTMDFLEHDSGDFITKVMPVTYNEDAKAPVWERFLEEAVPSAEIRKLLQVLAGYTMTGRSTEKKLMWLYGPSNTGKSVFLNVLSLLFGHEYGTTANDGLLYGSRASSGPSESLNNLRNRRLVVASETGKERLDEVIIKRLTGKDTINSRGLYQNEGTWSPEFVMWIASNTTPFLHGDDDAIWGRFLPVEFNQVVTPGSDQYDPYLLDKLENELEGILNWALEGLRMYNKEGLVIPAEASTFQKSFREEADPVAQFIAEIVDEGNYVLDSTKEVLRTPFHEEFSEWMVKQGRKAWSAKTFYTRLESQGFTQRRVAAGRYIVGIGSPFKGNY